MSNIYEQEKNEQSIIHYPWRIVEEFNAFQFNKKIRTSTEKLIGREKYFMLLSPSEIGCELYNFKPFLGKDSEFVSI